MKEAAGGAVVGEFCCPENGIDSLFEGFGSLCSSHVGLDPAGADGVDEDVIGVVEGSVDARDGV